MPVLLTKLHRPSIPTDLVLRPRLFDRMNEGQEHPMILVSSPAGYGKTTLVRSWLGTCQRPGAWLSLDEYDNDLREFLVCLLAAVRSAFPESLVHTEVLLSGVELPPIDRIVKSLSNELDELACAFILVLDDVQEIREQAIYNVLNLLLRHPSKNLQLVLITRRDPPLALSQLRAHNQITEIRVQDLRFTREEIAAFTYRSINTPLNDDALTVLSERTEGWAAGLRLAALTLRYSQDVNRHVAELHAENRYVMDYLFSEVLTHVPAEIEGFLIKTSILDWLCGSLCDALIGWDGQERQGQAFLDWLESRNLFTESRDEQKFWYRYHGLFRRLLLGQLTRRLSDDEITILHNRASAWFANQGMAEEAIRHALVGHDTARAVQVVAAHRHRLLDTEQRPLLDRWLRMFPNAALIQHPDLLLARAWTAELRRDDAQSVLHVVDQAQTLVSQMVDEPVRARQLQGEIDTLRSIELGFAARDPRGVITLTTRALAVMPKAWYMVRSEAWLHLALAHQLIGQLDQSCVILESAEGEDAADTRALRLRISGSRGFVDWMAADLPGILRRLPRILNVGQFSNQRETLGWAHYFIASACYQRNDLAAAEQHANVVFDKRYACHRITVVQSACILAATFQARGQPAAARQVLGQAREFLLETRSEALLPVCEAFAAEIAAMQGDFNVAGRWATTVGPHLPLGIMAFFYAPQLTLPRVLVRINTPASRQQAAEALSRLHTFVTTTHNTRFTIDVLGLYALLFDAEGKETAALQHLTQALTLARAGGLIRVFVDLGPAMAHLLQRPAVRNIFPDYIEHILQALPDPAPAAWHDQPVQGEHLVKPLTRREIEVLELLAKRFSAKEIARALVISEQTAKRHTANIYHKLGVNNRQQAIAAAAALNHSATAYHISRS